MIDRTTKLRWRRRYKRGRRQVEDLSFQAEEQLERNLIRRLSRLFNVRRFVAGWITLLCLLIVGLVIQIRALSPYYQVLTPVAGGTYTEGILGSFTNANPLYAAGGVDGAVASLVFAGLMKYTPDNQLVGDLSEKIDVDERGVRYTLTLRDDLKWHDGEPLTSADVVFTYKTIQNPDARSPLFNSWQGIAVEAPNAKTVVFTLPNPLSAFPHALINGIVPKHLLESTPPSQLRSISFNTVRPIGAGPFKWRAIEVKGDKADTREEQISLVPFEQYHGGVSKLEQFIIRSFREEARLIRSFDNQELNAMVGLSSMPELKSTDIPITQYNIPLTGQILVFFKTTQEILSDTKVRQALVKASDTTAIIRGLDHPVIASRGPLLRSHTGYDKNIVQFPTNVDEANSLLDSAGWIRRDDGLRYKGDRPLSFSLLAQNTNEYTYVTQTLQRQWRTVGIDVQVSWQPDTELQNTAARHDYDALLYGISLGVDPDVFPYWHSSQADPLAANRLNLSEYKSTVADKSLEAGRTRADSALRAIKYRPFLEAWKSDAPALALYQPRFLYIVRAPLAGFDPRMLNNATDRFENVENWMIRQEKAIRQK